MARLLSVAIAAIAFVGVAVAEDGGRPNVVLSIEAPKTVVSTEVKTPGGGSCQIPLKISAENQQGEQVMPNSATWYEVVLCDSEGKEVGSQFYSVDYPDPKRNGVIVPLKADEKREAKTKISVHTIQLDEGKTYFVVVRAFDRFAVRPITIANPDAVNAN